VKEANKEASQKNGRLSSEELNLSNGLLPRKEASPRSQQVLEA
jgi:hypothetical protein